MLQDQELYSGKLLKMKTYKRVAPRDLFNEAKLLKCLGRLALLILDHKAPEGLSYEDSGNPYEIGQDSGSGDIHCVSGIRFKHKGQILQLYTGLNSREAYPLVLRTDDYEEYYVFDEKGNFTSDFITALEGSEDVHLSSF